MSEALRTALEEALDSESRAEATFEAAIAAFGPVEPFVGVVEAARRNTDDLLRLFERHGLEPPANRWRGRIPKPADVAEACQTARNAVQDAAGCYDRLIDRIEAEDARAVIQRLRDVARAMDLPMLKDCCDRSHHLDSL
jgi:hypothetical protein